MEELQPSIQSGLSCFDVRDGNGFSGHIACSDHFGAPSTCSASASVSSGDDEYADMFQSFSGGGKAPSVPFLEFLSDFEADVGRISGETYSDIFGGFGWDLAVSLEELLGGLSSGAENKDPDSRKNTSGQRKPQKLPAEFVTNASENSDKVLFSSLESVSMASKSTSQNSYKTEEQLEISYKVINHTHEENSMDEKHVNHVNSLSVLTSTIDDCFSSLEQHIKRTTTLLDRSSADFLTQICGDNLKESDCNIHAMSHDVEMISASQNNSGNNNYEPQEVFLTVTEINLQTQPTQRPPPSRQPPKLETGQSDSKRRLRSSRKDRHENGIHNLVNRIQRHHTTIASEIHVVEEASKACFPPCLDVGIDTKSSLAASIDSMKEVRNEAEAKKKMAMDSWEIGEDTKDNKMLCARDGKRSKQRKECKTFHEFFELAEMTSAVCDRRYQQTKDGQKPPQEPVELEPIKSKRDQQNYNYEEVFRTFQDGSELEATRKMRNAPQVVVLQEIEAESMDKSSGEKVFKQGLLTKETSVQKTAEGACEQAGETAMVEKVVLEARDRVEMELFDMLTASLRDMRNEDDQYESCDGTSTVNSMRHIPTSEEKNIQSDESIRTFQSTAKHPEFVVETEERKKARSQRCQRTAERVAKALAEKKARDILVQKEQAERSMLAETLDGDIKRWSLGKEGNLRALLSTLQYILWPESGWQPVPLTEVITAAAVKKAYRKATLCLHPDKVQQKGASIQQKYIAEKVFYLLKDAWNKFNYEEC